MPLARAPARRCRGLVIALWVALWITDAGAAQAQAVKPGAAARIKENLIYHFAHLVSWPRASFSHPSAPIRICFLGDSVREVAALARDRAAQVSRNLKRRPKGRTLLVETIDRRSLEGAGVSGLYRSLRRCHILYADVSASGLHEALRKLEKSPVLTVGDGPSFAKHRGIISFVVAKKHIRLHANVDRASRADLTVGARLLQHAVIVSSDSE